MPLDALVPLVVPASTGSLVVSFGPSRELNPLFSQPPATAPRDGVCEKSRLTQSPKLSARGKLSGKAPGARNIVTWPINPMCTKLKRRVFKTIDLKTDRHRLPRKYSETAL